MPGLPIWVVYDHPADFPYSFVARLWIGEQPTEVFMCTPDLNELRTWLLEMGLVKLMPMPGDNPRIMETWL